MQKTAFITDWLDKYGGAERVVTAINEIYEFDYYYAYVNKMTEQLQKKTFADREVKVISSKIMSLFKFKFRVTMPIFPLIIKMFNKQTKNNEIDLVISSSWTMSKGYRIGKEIHICYLQARNFKYVWDEADLYFKGPMKLFSFIKGYLQKFDLESSKIPDHLISNSLFVQNWVKEKYKRDSVVIYPPVDVEDFYISDFSEDYYITVGRLEPYKRFDIIIEAFSRNKKKLLVIGDGSELKYLKSIAGSNIEFKGYLDKGKIKDYLSKSKAFVFAGVEDFGIVIIEAHASGVPTIVFNGGAANEIVNKVNGMCYEIQSAESLNKEIVDFENQYMNYDKNKIRESSLKFSKERFKCEMKSYVELLKVKYLPHLY
jgi:glycosyltransferase involved in cell wall biosynthesis